MQLIKEKIIPSEKRLSVLTSDPNVRVAN